MHSWGAHHECPSMEENIKQISVSSSHFEIPLRIQTNNKRNSDLTTAWINLKNVLFREGSPVCTHKKYLLCDSTESKSKSSPDKCMVSWDTEFWGNGCGASSRDGGDVSHLVLGHVHMDASVSADSRSCRLRLWAFSHRRAYTVLRCHYLARRSVTLDSGKMRLWMHTFHYRCLQVLCDKFHTAHNTARD